MEPERKIIQSKLTVVFVSSGALGGSVGFLRKSNMPKALPPPFGGAAEVAAVPPPKPPNPENTLGPHRGENVALKCALLN